LDCAELTKSVPSLERCSPCTPRSRWSPRFCLQR